MSEKNDKIHKRSIKKMDALVTGILLGWVVASIYGIKKSGKHLGDKKQQESKPEPGRTKKIIKMLVFGYQEPEEEKKKGFFSRIFKR